MILTVCLTGVDLWTAIWSAGCAFYHRRFSGHTVGLVMGFFSNVYSSSRVMVNVRSAGMGCQRLPGTLSESTYTTD